ncbi:MAG: DnaJ domain-containing protein [Gammaproteobacteria bacterium]|nr:DnaJ domain-containing protein [Gammaproteobacteria bacterium]
MRILIMLAAALLLYLLAFRWFTRQPRSTRIQTLMVIAGLLLVGLAATGRLNWVFALLGALLPFVQRLLALLSYLPVLQRLYRQFGGGAAATGGGGSTGQQSKVESRFLQLILDHDSGAMSGRVLAGRYQGEHLSQLSLEQLLSLLQEYRQQDSESADLLEAFLDRQHGDAWRTEAQQRAEHNAAGFAERMTRQEAFEILGLTEGADRDQITAAHRRLIQKLHPDHGGTSYLAWKINQAKAVLLDRE